jgi:hypothetical protein
MAWEYLEQPVMDERYKIASEFIGENDKVVDVDSGNSRLRNYVKHYYSNDLNYKEADVQCTDEEFVEMVKECDVLCCFGIGGHEITHEPLESPTLTHSLVRLAMNHHPHTMILECIDQFVPIVESILKQTGYKVEKHIKKTYDADVPDQLRYVMNRNMFICKQ